MKRIFLLLSTFVLLTISSFSQQSDKYLERNFIGHKGDTLLYRIAFPKNYDVNNKYPLLLFLHGAGERGNDNIKQLVHGASLFVREDIQEKYASIVVFPQCPERSSWSVIDLSGRSDKNWSFPFFEEPMPAMNLVMQLLEKLMKEEGVDPSRLYVSGLSMGGFGTFDILARMPGRFAAAAPICGGGNSGLVGLYNDTPVWIFHGAKDSVVPVENSRKMYEALKKWGAKVKYTEYPAYTHNSWDAVFADPQYLEWMFSQKKE